MNQNCDPKSKKANDDKYICNPKTGRWVLRTGKIGQEIIGKIKIDSPKKIVIQKKSEKLPVQKTFVASNYLEYAQFKRKYPIGRKISEGSFHNLYESGSYMINELSISEPKFEAFIREIDFYSAHDHPCILKIIDFSFDSFAKKTYFSIPKAQNIIDAYTKDLITLRQIASDLIDVLQFLHSDAVAHRNIKPANVVYFEGKACLINFGIARQCKHYQNDGLFFEGSAYTLGYRDPEVDFKTYNSIKCDLYALAKTLMAIHFKQNLLPDEYIYTLFSFEDSDLNDFIRQCTLPINQRPSAQSLANHKIIERKYQSKVLETPTLPIDPNCGKILVILCEWLLSVGNQFKLHSRTMFLTLHLVHRSLSLMVPGYKEKNKIQLVGLCCLQLACAINDEIQDFRVLSGIADNAYHVDAIAPMCVRIMGALKGIVHTVNYWDFASCFEDLPVFLEDVFKCKYTPIITRHPLNLPTSKDVPFSRVYKIFKKKFGQSMLNTLKANVHETYEPETIEPAIVRPIKGRVPQFNCNDVLLFISDLTDQFDLNEIWKRSGSFVANPHCLQQLDLYTAIKFYNLMKNHAHTAQLLPRLVKFNLKVHKDYPFLKQNLHPFKATLRN